jgi:Fe2+ or Zn2+ uptake regulation protein
MHPQLEVIFAEKQLRLTTPRQTVFDVMHASDTPLSIKDIAGKASGVDRVSVYRTIELFIKLGIAEAVPLGWKQRYELTSPFKAHHHHLYCTKCSKLIDIHSQKLELIVAHIAKEYGFKPNEHKFEVSGLCEKCQSAAQ